ncbi:MoaF C-terminal domain-containing protein [Acidocella sp. KAb 2-4]|uniref:MoaF C-terminal domain-containing protein n=1 Tax=Acidocella sp. KAb 2-4 TaxID=2885158 RepID=UPI001D0719A1|nr:MoaF N-terminal domain-containing protein [Acidocella sp. KAb 2-4]
MNGTGNWISVGDLAGGFAQESNILSPSYGLVGKTIDLAFDDGTAWQVRITLEAGRQFVDFENELQKEARITSLRDSLYFIDFLVSEKSMTLIVDYETGSALIIEGGLPSAEEISGGLLARAKVGLPLTAVKVSFRRARVAGKYGQFGFPRTSELVGKRIRYQYSVTELYEHIYLNDMLYTWHCLNGVEAGLADTDLCHYFKIRDSLYLFVWQEKVVPTLGIILVDLERFKTDGKIFGNMDFLDDNISNFAVGAIADFVNFTQPSNLE